MFSQVSNMRPMIFDLAKRTLIRSLSNTSVGPKSFEEMPGPRSREEIETSWQFHPESGEYSFGPLHVTYLKMKEKYGDIVREVVKPGQSVVHVFGVKDIKTIYDSTNRSGLPSRCSHTALAQYRKERPHLYKHEGLLSTNGEEWLTLRKAVEEHIFRPPNHKNYYPVIEEAVDYLVKLIPSRLDENGEIDILPFLKRWGVEMSGRITLGKSLGCLEKEDPDVAALIEAAEITHETSFLTENGVDYELNYKRLEAAQDILAGFVKDRIDEIMPSLQSEEYKNSVLYKFVCLSKMDERDARMMITEMFLAGVDTVAFALSYLLHRLARDKTIQDRLRDEVRAKMPTKDTVISETIPTFKFLLNVINEGFRMDPTAIGLGRILSEDLVLSGYLVPKGTTVILQHQIASMMEKHCQNPTEFNPDRRFKFGISLPFGGLDSRNCVGFRLAQHELRLALVKIIRNFEVRTNLDEEIRFKTRLLNFPDQPIKFIMKSVD